MTRITKRHIGRTAFTPDIRGMIVRVSTHYITLEHDGETHRLKRDNVTLAKRGRKARGKAPSKIQTLAMPPIPDFLKGPRKSLRVKRLEIDWQDKSKTVRANVQRDFAIGPAGFAHASQYVRALIGDAKPSYVKTGLMATLPCGSTITANYNIRHIIRGKLPPHNDLPPMRVISPRSEIKMPKSTTTTNTKARSNTTPLKDVCAELKMNPKQARIILRKHKDDFEHAARGRWEFDAKELKRVKSLLAGDDKPAPRKRKPADEKAPAKTTRGSRRRTQSPKSSPRKQTAAKKRQAPTSDDAKREARNARARARRAARKQS